MQVDTRTDTMSNIASYYGINSKKLQRHYKKHVSGYSDWEQKSHAENYLLYPENIDENLSIDEVSLSKGELYTIITNKKRRNKNKKSLVAIINGTDAKTIQNVLEQIPIEKRNSVKEVSMDMARNMSLAIENSFHNASQVIDRFHVVRLVIDAMQHIRIQLRWDVIEAQNKAIKQAREMQEKYYPEILSNGDTLKELLARSRYLLYKSEDEWTINQLKRAEILFEKFPQIKQAYDLTMEFRSIYKNELKSKAITQFNQWKNKVLSSKIDQFNTVLNSIEYHFDEVFNYFDNKSTNGYAESFNSKIKGFRANLRGVTDIRFFLFRLQKLFA